LSSTVETMEICCTSVSLPCRYFCVCSACLAVKVFAFKSISLTSWHDSHLLYTRHNYRHLLSCRRESVPAFSYDETRVGRYISQSVHCYCVEV